MKKLLAIALVAGGLVFGAASAASMPFRTAMLWALGGSAAASTAVGIKRIVCRTGDVIEYTDDGISFISPAARGTGRTSELGHAQGTGPTLRMRCRPGSMTRNEARSTGSPYRVNTRASSACTASCVEGDTRR